MVDEKFIQENTQYPIVYMGDAVTDFYKYFDGPVVKIGDKTDDLREAVAYYTGISDLGRDLVFDISFVKDTSPLLKFLEETSLNVVLLSRYDNIDNVIASRLMRVVKYYRDQTDSQFLRMGAGLEVIENKLSDDTSYYDKVRYYGKYSPFIYMFKNTIKSNKVWNRLTKIM